MSQKFQKTKPSFLEAGLPCASLSAECQRDNNARQRPPQNRLHIWWARRPPTICRAAILAGLLPHDLDLNPVAALVLKATVEYPARFGRALAPKIETYARQIHEAVRTRLSQFFLFQPSAEWWLEEKTKATKQFKAKAIVSRQPAEGQDPIKNTYLWLRTVPCSKCDLNIPISTNCLIVSKKGKPEAGIAAFPVVPRYGQSNDCTFRIVPRAEWKDCIWPRPGFERWDPRDTPTFKDGRALCPRCGQLVDGDDVKSIARSREGGLAAQMYAVCSQVPVKLTYRNGDMKVRYLWRFRAPTQGDLDAVRAAEEELTHLRPRWEVQDLIPTEEIPEGEKTKEPRNMNFMRWRDLFLPRQLLTNVVILEEIRDAQARARAELPEAEAEAVSVYLAFILSKVVNYNSVNTFWDYTRIKGAQTFSRHDFAFRAAFSEFEGARETVMWGASQVIGAYEQLAGLIHGDPVSLEGVDDEGEGDESLDEEGARDEETSDEEDESQEAVAVAGRNGQVHLRSEVIVPTVTCDDAAALSVPAPGTVHLICVDPPYYNNVQYAELSNFFYVWLKALYHPKAGILYNGDGNIITFQGSVNETSGCRCVGTGLCRRSRAVGQA